MSEWEPVRGMDHPGRMTDGALVTTWVWENLYPLGPKLCCHCGEGGGYGMTVNKEQEPWEYEACPKCWPVIPKQWTLVVFRE